MRRSPGNKVVIESTLGSRFAVARGKNRLLAYLNRVCKRSLNTYFIGPGARERQTARTGLVLGLWTLVFRGGLDGSWLRRSPVPNNTLALALGSLEDPGEAYVLPPLRIEPDLRALLFRLGLADHGVA